MNVGYEQFKELVHRLKNKLTVPIPRYGAQPPRADMASKEKIRSYGILEYPAKVKEYFAFLINGYGYRLEKEEHPTVTYIHVFEKDSIRVHLNYDIRDNFFYFYLTRGEGVEYSVTPDPERLRPLFRLFEKYEPGFDLRSIQPDENQYLDALRLTAELLKKYGDGVLKGKEWF